MSNIRAFKKYILLRQYPDLDQMQTRKTKPSVIADGRNNKVYNFLSRRAIQSVFGAIPK